MIVVAPSISCFRYGADLPLPLMVSEAVFYVAVCLCLLYGCSVTVHLWFSDANPVCLSETCRVFIQVFCRFLDPRVRKLESI